MCYTKSFSITVFKYQKMKKLVTTILFFLSFAILSFSQVTPFTYRQCIEGTLRDNYQPAPCEITGISIPASIWIIQVGAYRQNITPIPGVMMIPYELNRYYLFSFQDVGVYKGSLFFSTREAASSFIQENGLNELFCQVFPAQFPFQDVIAYTSPSTGTIPREPVAQRFIPISAPQQDTIPVHYNDLTSTQYTYHQVQAKETLFSLAKRYSTTVDKIKQLNNLTSDILTIGATLRVQ